MSFREIWKDLTKNEKIISLSGIAAALIGIAIAMAVMPSCTATRIVTTQAQYVQRGDTTIIIQTKTTEQFKGEKQ